jgi:hypothetical protein
MLNAAIGFAIALFLACLFRFAGLGGPYSELGSLVAFLFVAVFGAMILVGSVSRIGHTPRGAASLLAGAFALCAGVYYWLDLGRTFDGGLETVAAVTEAEAADGSLAGPHPAPDLLTQSQ